MPDLLFRAPRYGDIAAIWPRMEPIERLEVEGAGGPKAAIRKGLKASSLAWTATLDGRPEAVLGLVVSDLLGGLGRPWMLRTTDASRAGRAFLTQAPSFVRAMEAVTPKLENWVHPDNRQSIAWLRRLGFAFDDEIEHIGSVPMRRFSKGF